MYAAMKEALLHSIESNMNRRGDELEEDEEELAVDGDDAGSVASSLSTASSKPIIAHETGLCFFESMKCA